MTFLHSGARGDIIYALPAIQALDGGVLYIKLDAKHYKSRVMTPEDVILFRELLSGQDYILDVKVWDGIPVDYDLDTFREGIRPCQLLSEAHLERFSLTFDLSQPWLNVSGLHVADIVIGRSERYHGAFNWAELVSWQDRCLFVGLRGEYEAFTAITGLNVPYYGECTYRKLAEVIAGSKLFIGNQSFPYSLAEAIKHPRVLEVCPICPNCLPKSSNGFTHLNQNILRHFILGEPLKQEHSINFGLPVIGMKMRSMARPVRPDITYILVHAKPCSPDFVGKNSEVKWDEGKGDYRKTANDLARFAQGKVICVVDMAKLDDLEKARQVAELLLNLDGMAGMYLKQTESLMISDACFAVSRKAYEQCGLFNLNMLAGQYNLVEMVLRYGQKKCPCRTAGTIDLPLLDDNAERNKAYIRKIYGDMK
jgi:hypothetical protein